MKTVIKLIENMRYVLVPVIIALAVVGVVLIAWSILL